MANQTETTLGVRSFDTLIIAELPISVQTVWLLNYIQQYLKGLELLKHLITAKIFQNQA